MITVVLSQVVDEHPDLVLLKRIVDTLSDLRPSSGQEFNEALFVLLFGDLKLSLCHQKLKVVVALGMELLLEDVPVLSFHVGQHTVPSAYVLGEGDWEDVDICLYIYPFQCHRS